MPNTLRFARLLLLVVLVVYWLTIAWGTHTSGDSLGELWLDDKLLHFSAFLGLVALMSWTLMQRQPTVRRVVGVLLVAVLYGVLDEVTQAWIPGRHPTIADWLADCLGAVTGMVFYLGSSRRLERSGAERVAEPEGSDKGAETTGPAAAPGAIP